MQIEIGPDPFLRTGPITPERTAEVIAEFSRDPLVGGITTFSGVIRADETPEGRVRAIEFSAYREMAEPGIREMAMRVATEISDRYENDHTSGNAGSNLGPLRLHVEHSIGEVKVGESPILIVAGAGHRPEAFDLCRTVLEAVKAEIPIYGKELFETEGYRWKKNR